MTKYQQGNLALQYDEPQLYGLRMSTPYVFSGEPDWGIPLTEVTYVASCVWSPEITLPDPWVWVQAPQSISYGTVAYNGYIQDMMLKDIGQMVRQDEKKNNIQLLDSFLDLEEDWNEHGARPFKREHIDFVKSIVQQLDPQPEIFPTAAYGIHLEYDKDNGDVLIFDVKENGTIKEFKKEGKKTFEKPISLEDLFNEVAGYFKG